MNNAQYTLVGVMIGGIISALTTWLSLKQQSKQHRDTMIIQSSLEIWRRQCETTDRINNTSTIQRALAERIGTPNIKDPEFLEIAKQVQDSLKKLTPQRNQRWRTFFKTWR